jgi:hypothetical protein
MKDRRQIEGPWNQSDWELLQHGDTVEAWVSKSSCTKLYTAIVIHIDRSLKYCDQGVLTLHGQDTDWPPQARHHIDYQCYVTPTRTTYEAIQKRKKGWIPWNAWNKG